MEDEFGDLEYVPLPEEPAPAPEPRRRRIQTIAAETQARIIAQAALKTAEKLAVTDAPPPVAPAKPVMVLDMGATIFPMISTATPQGGQNLDKWHVVILGAGGVGARIAPLLVKHLSNGDRMTIIDGDLVEGKNLMRQHFVADDIGQYKAQVVADRAKLTAPRSGIEVGFVPMFLDSSNAGDLLTGLLEPHSTPGHELFGEFNPNLFRSLMIISAVDTLKARNILRHGLRDVWNRHRNRGTFRDHKVPQSTIWIDAGNAMSSGQAMLSAFMTWQTVTGMVTGKKAQKLSLDPHGVNETWHSILPDFLNRVDAPETAGANCALRIDTQSVLANTWAALSAATIAIPIISHAGIRTAGVGFSTSGMATSAPLSEKCITEVYGSPTFKWVSRRLA